METHSSGLSKRPSATRHEIVIVRLTNNEKINAQHRRNVQKRGLLMDIIGIGALNIDYIKAMPWSLSPSHRLHTLRQDFEPGREEWVSNDNITQRIRKIGTTEFDYMGPGGSAFNTIRCIAQMNLGLRLGYIGIAGAPSKECDLQAHIAKNAIDSTYIFNSTNPAGKCISLYWPRERTRGLRTSPGVDRELEIKLADPHLREEIAHYIARARWVHLTSFIDQEVLTQVTQILKSAKRENPTLLISFDPGSEYCRNPTPQVKDAISLSDYLFINWNEFCQLGGYEEAREVKRGRTAEKEIAFDISNMFLFTGSMVVMKSYRSIRFFRLFQNRITSRHYRQVPLLPPFIVDDTGAGDIFTAGFIAAHLVPALSFDVRTTMLICTRLVKAKLGFTGCDGETVYAKIVQQVLDKIQQRESINFGNLAKIYLSDVGSFFLGVLISTIAEYILSLFIR